MSRDMLIGYTGLVGSALREQYSFASLYNSRNIDNLVSEPHRMVVCCAAPAVKWLANKQPQGDKDNIKSLIDSITLVQCKKFVLISTVDVFKIPNCVDERTKVEKTNLDPYGLHRRELEEAVIELFPDALIVRLPGLVSNGLKKNVIYDLVNENNLENCDLNSVFQFYPLSRLWRDIEVCIKHELTLVHLTAEPIVVKGIVEKIFPSLLSSLSGGDKSVAYDFRTIHGKLFGGPAYYQCSEYESLEEIKAYKSHVHQEDSP